MGWNKDGSTIKALYLSEYMVTGKVTESRVRYGGTVSYHIDLVEPLFLFGTLRDSVIVDETQVLVDFGIIEVEYE
jgi:curli biogenesis system outer membrane secretion channel CsgG